MVCNASWFMIDVIAPHAVYKTPYFNLEKKSSKTGEIKFAFLELTSAFPIKNCIFKNLDSLLQVNTISVNNLSTLKAIQPGPLN